MSSNAPVPVVCAIIMRQGRILLAQRPEGKRLAGLWEFPGGKVETGESPATALHRELAEELGCRVAVLEAGPPTIYGYEWGAIVLHPFVCELGGAECEPVAHEHQALLWVSPDELLRPDLAPADKPVVKWFLEFLG